MENPGIYQLIAPPSSHKYSQKTDIGLIQLLLIIKYSYGYIKRKCISIMKLIKSQCSERSISILSIYYVINKFYIIFRMIAFLASKSLQ